MSDKSTIERAPDLPDESGSNLSDQLRNLGRELENSPSGSPPGSSELSDDFARIVESAFLLDGRYKLVRKIGEGSQGEVWEAVDCQQSDRLGTECRVAVKLAFTPKHRFAHLLDLRREVLRMTATASERIVNVEDFGHVEIVRDGQVVEVVYFTMPLLTGMTIADEIRRFRAHGAGMPWRMAWQRGRDVLIGLDCIHGSGQAHRDIKPSNLYVRAPNDFVMILDLGLAEFLTPLADDSTGNRFVGTPLYLPPEALTSAQKAERSWDLYALGVTLAQMVSRVELFSEITDKKMARADLMEALQAAHRENTIAGRLPLDAGLPPICRQIVAKATNPDPALRYHSVRELDDALQQALATADAGLPMAAVLTDDDEPSSPSGHATPGKRRAPALILGLVFLIALLGLGAYLLRGNNEPVAGPIKGHIDFVLAQRAGQWIVEPEPRRLGDANTSSLMKGDRGHLDAELSEGPPAHFYVLWIDSAGTTSPHFPAGWTWQTLPPTDEQRRDLRWPPEGEAPLANSPTGLECIVWLVRPTPLSAADNAKLRTILTAPGFAWQQNPKNPEEHVFVIENGKITRDRGALEINAAGVLEHPVLQMEAVLRQIKNQKLASYSRAVCYPFVNP